MNFTPQPTPFPASQASVGNRQRRPTLEKEACCRLAGADFLPWPRRISLPGARELPGQLSTHSTRDRSSSPHGLCQACTVRQTDLERNTLVLFPPHPPATSPPLMVGGFHTQVLQSASKKPAQNIHLPEEASHLTWRWGRGGGRVDEQIIPSSHIRLRGIQ